MNLYSYPAHGPHCQTQYQCWGCSSTITQELNIWDNLEINPQHCPPPKNPHCQNQTSKPSTSVIPDQQAASGGLRIKGLPPPWTEALSHNKKNVTTY